MQKQSPQQTLENAILWSFVELLEEVKRQNRNSENMVMRDIKGLHRNTTKGDMPDYLKKALASVTQGASGYLRSNGYAVTSTTKNDN